MYLSLEAGRRVLPAAHGLTPLPGSIAVLIGLAALVTVLWKEVWVITGHVSVLAHEGAHALVGWGTGRRVKSVTVSLDDRGLVAGATLIPGLGKSLGGVITGFVGYAGPSLFGLGAAKLITMNHIQAVLWLTVVGLAGLLLFVRNARGFVSVAAAGGLVLLVLWRGQAGLQTVTCYALTWFMLVSGVRGVLEDGPKASDAGILKQWTSVPKMVWFAVWLAGTLGALAAGGHMLV